MSRKSLDLTLGFLRSLDRTASTQDVALALNENLASLGIAHVLAGMVPAPGTRRHLHRGHVLINTYPDGWVNRYMSRGYAYMDPVVDRAQHHSDPFSWDELRTLYRDDRMRLRIFDEAGDFALNEGISVPLLTLEGDVAVFSFSGSRLGIDPGGRAMLQLVASYAFGQLLLLRSQAPNPIVRLAPRERETLQWAAEGKSDCDIGDLMGISRDGVSYHFRSIRAKLGTSNRTHAVAMALRLGLIS